MTDELRQKFDDAWRTLRRRDQLRLAAGREKLLNWEKEGNGALHAAEVNAFLARFASAAESSIAAKADALQFEFPDELPISPLIPEIVGSLKKNPVTIVCGSTGSGKTTQLPKAALAAGLGRNGLIGCTQPRRIAATALACRLAEELHVECGKEVGIKIRFDNRTDKSTVVKFMTDGILLAESRSDRNLDDYSCIILDEAHERSLNIDFLLGCFKTILTHRRDLRIVISSATLESKRISEFFDNAPVFEIPGGLHPIEDCYFPELAEIELPQAVARAVDFASGIDPRGDALVFLPGEREIRDTMEVLKKGNLRQTEILPLYGRLTSDEQQKIFHRGNLRRIVLTTNVAETSLTIPGIRFVIDSGLVRLSRYNPRLRLQELRVEFASQAAIRQRRGRCGRVSDGVCLHLYGEEALKQAPEYTAPEIQRASLAGVILQMAELRLPDIENFPFLDPPGAALIKEGRTTLTDLRAMTPDLKITPLGHELAKLPVDPHLGKLLIDARKVGEIPVMAVIAAGLSLPDPAERPFEEAKKADECHRKFSHEKSDFLGMVKLWRAFHDGENRPANETLRNFCKKNFYNFRRLREWRALVGDLLEIFAPGKEKITESETRDTDLKYDLIHKLLLGAMPRRLAVYDPEQKNYFDMNGKRFTVFPGSGLARCKTPPPWLLVLTLMETSRVWARCVAEAKPQYLVEVAPQLCRMQYDQVRFEAERGYVTARERITAGALPIHPGRRRHYGSVDPEKAREVFLADGIARGLARSRTCLWIDRFNEMRKKIENLEIRMRCPGHLLDEEAITAFFRENLPPDIISVDAAEKRFQKDRRDYAPPEDVLIAGNEDISDDLRRFPSHWTAGGVKMALHYEFAPGEENDGVTALVRERELEQLPVDFGEWNVPGYLAWKVEFLLKKLPREERRKISPLAGCAASFADGVLDGSIFTDRDLAGALAEYLAGYCNVHVSASLFDGVELPDFTQLKLAVTDSRQRVLKILTEVPASARGASRLAIRRNGNVDTGPWEFLPSDLEIPGTVTLRPSGKIVYPALVVDDDGHFSRADFLDESEAKYRHRLAILALYRKKFSQQVTYLERKVTFANEIVMTLFLDYEEWRHDLADLAILAALEAAPETLRDASAIERALSSASQNFGRAFDSVTDKVKKFYFLFEAAKNLAKRLKKDTWSRDDVDYELIFLARDGFLRAPEIFYESERFLKALRQRLDRAVSAPLDRDGQKGEAIAPYIERFQLAASEYTLEDHGHLADFYLLLAEARIACFAPEIGVKIKSAAARLPEAWQSLRLS
ncbi:MAG: ATP-dependent RNA helicase HrpA [Victivallaceae bacterium]|nr:ATP-dependent RNA helicase HrpA [Victivallaceae bacterium]